MTGLIRVINRPLNYAGRARDLMLQLVGRLVENVGGFRDIVARGRFRQFTAQFDQLLQKGQRLNDADRRLGPDVWACAGLDDRAGRARRLLCRTAPPPDIAEVGAVITYATLLNQLFRRSWRRPDRPPSWLSICRAWLLCAAFSNAPVAAAQCPAAPGADPLDRL